MKDSGISFKRAVWGVAIPPAAVAALGRVALDAVIDARVCDIGRREGFGRVHGEDLFSLRVVVVV